MKKSNSIFPLSTSIFLFVSFFMAPMGVVNADVSTFTIVKTQMCDGFLAAEDKKDDKDGKKGDGEEEPDCE